MAIVVQTIDAVVSVTRKPWWAKERARLELVTIEDRRVSQLPFVGRDRRGAASSAKVVEPYRQNHG